MTLEEIISHRIITIDGDARGSKVVELNIGLEARASACAHPVAYRLSCILVSRFRSAYLTASSPIDLSMSVVSERLLRN